MTVIVFLVDTSASMNQRTYLGTSLLDVAKSAVETFMKFRSRDPASRMDRYMLLTFEEPPANIKAGWKESHTTFVDKLKNLEALGLSAVGPSLKHAFDLLNVNRMHLGIDTYGMGKCPYYLEPAVIICITDGRKLTSMTGVQQDLNLPMNTTVPGNELTKEPFRWDQRLFSIVLRFPATVPNEITGGQYIPSADSAAIDAMCEVTGGRSYAVFTQRMLLQTLESMVQKLHPGVVINFEKIGPDPPDDTTKENHEANLNVPNALEGKRSTTPTSAAWHSCRKLVYVPRSATKGYSVGHWLIPESYWPDLNSPSLPARSANPTVNFSCKPCEPLTLENLPFDKYELEPSPLTQYILERRQPGVAWQVFVPNSAKYSEMGHPFGYIKASTNLTCVNLFVMPYNYPVLIALLEDLFKVHKLKPTQKWRQQFESYLKTMPIYYAGPLKRALAKMGAPNLVPDSMENCLSYSVQSYIKKIKAQAKTELMRLVNSVGQSVPRPDGIKISFKKQTSILERKDFHQLLKSNDLSNLKQEMTDYSSFTLAVPDPKVKPQMYRNAFDIPRKNLLTQITKMRTNFLRTITNAGRVTNEEDLHSIPIGQMGNYQEYLKKSPSALREIDSQPIRSHMFGNPFKVNKNMMIDETDEAVLSGSPKRSRASTPIPDGTSRSPNPKKRKGPLGRNARLRRPSSPYPKMGRTPEISEDSGIEMLSPDRLEILEENVLEIVSENVKPITNHIAENNGLGEEQPITDSLTRTDSDIENNGFDQPITNNITRTNTKKLKKTLKRENVSVHNKKLKIELIKQVKRPGKDYSAIFQNLDSLKGSIDMKCLVIREVINQAIRFKRRRLVEELDEFESSLVRLEIKQSTDIKVAT
ncbi:unnamed protein product [Owenia fusiformis]|uniref:Uncharacterized protein n=1 Tax=Owenia fusiformis TaxID=6347 RepID=A0A8J1YBT0_OWEFU|nr:unnamed protein product [Owenia fusiformis]